MVAMPGQKFEHCCKLESMKTAAAVTPSPTKLGHMLMSGFTPSLGKGRVQATSIILKTVTDPKRQHAAIGKWMKMCKASAVVTNASRGVTAEVRSWGRCPPRQYPYSTNVLTFADVTGTATYLA